MSDAARTIYVTVKVLLIILVVGFFVFISPSLIGLLIGAITVVSIFDVTKRRRRIAAKTFNSAVRAVCQHEGAVGKLAVAYSRGGPLAGPCYEYARRLMMGEHPVDAAAIARVPLQLSTAVALETSGAVDPAKLSSKPALSGGVVDLPSNRDFSGMPAYAQLMYLALTACATCLVMTFMTVFIVPTFEAMFDEFGLDLRHSALLSAGPTFWLIGIVLLLIMGTVIVANSSLFGLRRFASLPMTPAVSERKAELLLGLADAVEAGWPIGRALAIGHTIALRTDQRVAMEIAMRMMEQGRSADEALCRAGLVTVKEATWLKGASPQRTAEILRTIAEQIVRDAQANVRWLMSILFPVIVVALGMAVLMFAFGFFATLMELVNGLS